jgi:hypothetical protein
MGEKQNESEDTEVKEKTGSDTRKQSRNSWETLRSMFFKEAVNPLSLKV